jgi:hypothetical protein
MRPEGVNGALRVSPALGRTGRIPPLPGRHGFRKGGKG